MEIYVHVTLMSCRCGHNVANEEDGTDDIPVDGDAVSDASGVRKEEEEEEYV